MKTSSVQQILLFDPPLCCESGVCGPETDPELLRISQWVRRLTPKGGLQRYNLAHAPLEFAKNLLVRELLEKEGTDALPCLIVDGAVRMSGRYPSEKECEALEGALEAGACLS